MKYKVVSKHTELRDNGVPIEPNDEIDLTSQEAQEEHYARMIEDGVLVPLEGDSAVLGSPSDYSVEEVLAVFERSDPEAIAQSQQLEAEGKTRKGILEFTPQIEESKESEDDASASGV